MPVRIGFGHLRKQELEQELARIIIMFPQLGVRKAILIGDLVKQQVTPESSIDLVIVQDIPGSFVRRSDFFVSHMSPTVSTNFFVYTEKEFNSLKDFHPFIKNAIAQGKVCYDS